VTVASSYSLGLIAAVEPRLRLRAGCGRARSSDDAAGDAGVNVPWR
jgi:hypothetical protein